MDFIKRHLFFIAVIGAVIVVVGGAVAVTLPKASQNKERIAQRERLSGSLLRFGRSGGGYSPVQVEQMKGSVESQRQAETELTSAVLAANRQGFQPLTITDLRTDEAVPILPIDAQTHERLNVAWLFPDVYREAMSRLLGRLNPTMPPDQDEVLSAAKRVTNWLRRKQETEASKQETEVPVLPPGVTPPAATGDRGTTTAVFSGVYVRSSEPMEELPGAVERPWRPGTGAPGAPSEQDAAVNAASIALDRLNYERVNDPAHPLYVGEASFDYLSLDKTKRTEPDQIWKATVMYWLHQYLVDALLATNNEALAALHAGMPPGEPKPPLTISTAAVKRLVSVSIGGGEAAGTRMLYPYEIALQPGTARPAGALSGLDGGAPPPREANLTQRTGRPDCDVVHFEVEVVVNPTELPKLMRNLTNRGFVTVLNVRISVADQPIGSAAGTSGGRGGRGAVAESSFYYGTDPVVRVRLNLEAVFFADWSRPLMPVEMLFKLPDGVLRPADRERVQAASPTEQPGAGVPFGGSPFGY